MHRAVAALPLLLSATVFAQTPAAPAAPVEPAAPAAKPPVEPAKPAATPAKPAVEPAKPAAPANPPKEAVSPKPLAPAASPAVPAASVPPPPPAPAPAIEPPKPPAPAPPLPAPAPAKAPEPPAMPEPPPISNDAGIDPIPEDGGFDEDAFEDEAAPPPPTYPWFEQHGYYRLRLDWLDDLHLSNYAEPAHFVSGQPPPLTENVSNNSGDRHPETGNSFSRTQTSVSTGNMRFRYQPTIHLAENVRVRATIDMLDNLVLGSTPDGLIRRNDAPMLAFSGGQVPPESMRNSVQDSLRVKHAWGEWKTPLGLVRVGRQPSHWGMGILANGGGCEDCDFGDTNDRLMFVTKGLGTYIAVGYDIVATGATTTTVSQSAGQERDLDDADDVTQYILALFQRPLSPAEKQQRDYDLKRLRRPVLDFGLYGVYRSQELTSEVTQLDSRNSGRIPDVEQSRPNDGGVASPEGPNSPHYLLGTRNAEAYIPDVWAKFQWHPQRGHELTIEAEFAAIFGSIEDGAPDPVLGDPTKRDIRMWGGALKSDYRMDSLRLGFEVGAASGGELKAFGIHDGFAVPTSGDADITNFRFDRDYQVDLILFREIIGAVTNALYFKPTIEYDILRSVRSVLGLQLDVIYARALKAEIAGPGDYIGTPSGEANYGVEFDTSLFFREQDRFSLQLAYGLFIPMDAFKLPADRNEAQGKDRDAANAQTIQGRLVLKF